MRFRSSFSVTRLNYALHGAGLLTALGLAALGGIARQGLAEYRVGLAAQFDEAQNVARSDAEVKIRHAALADRLADARSKNTALAGRLTPTAGETRFVVQLADAATAAHVEIGGIHPGQKSMRDGLGQLSVDLQCGGSFAEIATLLDEIQKLPRACYVSSLKITSDGGRSTLQGEVGLHLLFGHPAAQGGR